MYLIWDAFVPKSKSKLQTSNVFYMFSIIPQTFRSAGAQKPARSGTTGGALGANHDTDKFSISINGGLIQSLALNHCNLSDHRLEWATILFIVK